MARPAFVRMPDDTEIMMNMFALAHVENAASSVHRVADHKGWYMECPDLACVTLRCHMGKIKKEIASVKIKKAPRSL